MKTALLIVFEFPPGPGGIGQHAYSIAESLVRKQYKVSVITSADYVDAVEISAFDAAHPLLHIRRINGWSFIKFLKRITVTFLVALRERPEHLIFSGKFALWIIPLIRMVSLKRSRVSAFLHGSEVRLPHFPERWLVTFGLLFAHRIFCVSHFTRDLVSAYVRKVKPVSILPNGINLNSMPGDVGDSNTNKYSGSPSLITVGQLSKRKGQHRVINALPYLVAYWPDIKYHMVGLDTDWIELQNLARKLNVEQHVCFHGRLSDRNDLLNAYRSCDVFIMLSENQTDGKVEGFGIAVLEANWCGLPAIGARGCGIEEAIAEGRSGYLVDGDNPEEIRKAISNCLLNKSMMQTTIQEWVESHNWDELILHFLHD